MKALEAYAGAFGLTTLTIGVEARETRTLGIYLHWGYDRFVTSETEEDVLVLYYAKHSRNDASSQPPKGAFIC